MPAWSSVGARSSALQNLSKKSLILLCDVQAEWSNPQVVFSPRKPKAKVGHLPITQGMEKATGMAPPRGVGVGWEPLLRLFHPNYGCSTSRGYATRTQNADYGGVAEAARFQPMRSVTEVHTALLPRPLDENQVH
jgi:hypothetical protein